MQRQREREREREIAYINVYVHTTVYRVSVMRIQSETGQKCICIPLRGINFYFQDSLLRSPRLLDLKLLVVDCRADGRYPRMVHTSIVICLSAAGVSVNLREVNVRREKKKGLLFCFNGCSERIMTSTSGRPFSRNVEQES